jgi:hypothetical protein
MTGSMLHAMVALEHIDATDLLYPRNLLRLLPTQQPLFLPGRKGSRPPRRFRQARTAGAIDPPRAKAAAEAMKRAKDEAEATVARPRARGLMARLRNRP